MTQGVSNLLTNLKKKYKMETNFLQYHQIASSQQFQMYGLSS